jgi:hypothetical protein
VSRFRLIVLELISNIFCVTITWRVSLCTPFYHVFNMATIPNRLVFGEVSYYTVEVLGRNKEMDHLPYLFACHSERLQIYSWIIHRRSTPRRHQYQICLHIYSNTFHYTFFPPMARQPYMGLGLLVSSRFHGHTHFRHITVGRTPLDEWSARRRDLYLTIHNTHKRQTSMP